MLKVRKKATFGFNLAIDISPMTTATASKSCLILGPQSRNIFSKTGIWTANALEMLKGRKKVKFDFNLPADISQTTTAKASQSCVIIRLEFRIIFSKTGVWTANALEMLKGRKKAKFHFNLPVDISQTATAKASQSCVILRLEFRNFFSKSAVWTENALEMAKGRKKRDLASIYRLIFHEPQQLGPPNHV